MTHAQVAEEDLFKALCIAHIEAGGSVGVGFTTWQRGSGRNQYIRRSRDDEKREWDSIVHLVVDIEREIVHRNIDFDEVAFFPEDGDDGVTWRFLKLDFPFLRIVLGGDSQMMLSVLTRLTQVLQDTLEGD